MAYLQLFIPLFEPDTNIVCFVVRPMTWAEGKLTPAVVSLTELNTLNGRVYAATSIAVRDGQTNSAQAQPFFVSRTRFAEEQYAAASIAPVLERAGVTAAAYAREGLFVLRSTVMNPWYGEAEAAGLDYLRAFVGHLHRTTYGALRGEPVG